MNTTTLRLFTASLAVAGTPFASAHIGYGIRDYGVLQPGIVPSTQTISIQTVTGNFGWADATDDSFGDTHKTRAFRFTLANPGFVTVSVAASTNGGTRDGGLLPAFSIYSGLAHVPPAAADHDGAGISEAYLLGLGGVAKEGSLVALGDWKIGNDSSLEPYDFDELSSFTYIPGANAADGSAANYGPASGINGDGLADGIVSGTFWLPAAGDYSFFVGGAQYSGGDLPTPDPTIYGISATVSVVPEPGCAALAGLAAIGLLARRRRA